ncbi:hypothetical protein, partial [Listeria monocytogenes]|uniref:hypothetical protein n=1 Tax=Listeria monocytogenes TaxID=1639 RepID=UPI0013C3F5CB
MQAMTSIKLQIAMYLIDKSEVNTIFGRTDFILEELYGRGMVKVGSQAIFQTTLPITGREFVEQINNLTAEIAGMKENW